MESTLNKEAAVMLMLQRKILCRFVFAFIFFFLLYYLYSNTLVHQLRSPVLIFPYVDITYWIFHLLKVPSVITGNYIIAFCFDISLFVFCVLSFLFPERRIFIIVFFIFYFIYYVIFNSYGNSHTHSKAGILLTTLPFIFPPNRMFLYMWEALRYFALFVYSDAFLWKLFRGNFLTKDHGSLIIKKNFAAYMYYHPHGLFANIDYWLFEHPGIIQILFVTGFIFEGCFIIGFFTKRFDKFLLIISILLPFGFLFLSNAFFFELLILSFTLIDLRRFSSGVVLTQD